MSFWLAAIPRLIRLIDPLLCPGGGEEGRGQKVEQELRGKVNTGRGERVSKPLGAGVDRKGNQGDFWPKRPCVSTPQPSPMWCLDATKSRTGLGRANHVHLF